MNTLPGIIAVKYLPCRELTEDVQYKSIAGVPVAVYDKCTAVSLTTKAECEVTEEPDNNFSLQKATLTFYTVDSIPRHEPLAFVVTTVGGETYLIGMKERPYPSIKISQTTGTPDGSAAQRKVEVTFSSAKALIPCLN